MKKSATSKPQDRLKSARQDRDDLLTNVVWLDDVKVASIGGVLSDAAEYASRLRRDKRLFGVRYRGEYLHPKFQFREDGQVHPAIASLLEILPSTDANWTAAFWLFQPHGRFSGKSPAEVFEESPNDVVELAREDFIIGLEEGDAVMPAKL